MKTGKIVAIVWILGFAVLRSLLLIYYLYLRRNCDIGFWQMLLGDVGVVDSKDII